MIPRLLMMENQSRTNSQKGRKVKIMKRILLAIKLRKMGRKLETKSRINSRAYQQGWRSCEMYEILKGKWIVIASTYKISDTEFITNADFEAMRVIAKYDPEMYDTIDMYEAMNRQFI